MTTAFRIGNVFASPTNVSTGTTVGVTTVSNDAATIHVQTTQAQPVSTVTDFYGNTYTPISVNPYTLGGATFYMYGYYCANITGGGGHTATVALSGGVIPLVFFFATWSGVLTTSPLDGTPIAHVDTGFITSHPGAAMTTASAGSIVIQHSFTQNNAAETFTAGVGAGYMTALSATGSAATYNTAFLQYRANAPAGAQAGVYTTANSNECGDVIFALKAAPVSVIGGDAGGIGGGVGGKLLGNFGA